MLKILISNKLNKNFHYVLKKYNIKYNFRLCKNFVCGPLKKDRFIL